jgi:radical SAM protein with 4Fe4S-binding SPASM domain
MWEGGFTLFKAMRNKRHNSTVEYSLTRKVLNFIKKFPHMGPTLARFPVPDTFRNAGLRRILFRLANYYAAYFQMLMKRENILSYPTHRIADVTNICNLRCPLCPTGAGVPGRKKGMMPFSTFRKIIDETGKYLISVDLFNWGEPLLNSDVYEMIAYAHRHSIVTTVSTNFQHFSEEDAEKLISSGLDILILSIDGASQESYEKYRIGGDFHRVVENISLLVEKKKEHGCRHPYICWQFLVMRHNEHEVETVKRMAGELGVDSVTIDCAFLPVATREEAMKWLPVDSRYHRYNAEGLENRWQEAERQQGLPQTDDRADDEDNSAGRDLKRRINCSWLWTQTTVNWDGSVSPCCAIYDPSEDFGNISEASFKAIWNNGKYRKSRRFSSKGEAGETLTVCMRCPLAMHD